MTRQPTSNPTSPAEGLVAVMGYLSHTADGKQTVAAVVVDHRRSLTKGDPFVLSIADSVSFSGVIEEIRDERDDAQLRPGERRIVAVDSSAALEPRALDNAGRMPT